MFVGIEFWRDLGLFTVKFCRLMIGFLCYKNRVLNNTQQFNIVNQCKHKNEVCSNKFYVTFFSVYLSELYKAFRVVKMCNFWNISMNNR
jgi:hypothetical protein